MFATFLIGTVLLTCLVMIVLLTLPEKQKTHTIRDALPAIGAGAIAVAAFIASVAGLAAVA